MVSPLHGLAHYIDLPITFQNISPQLKHVMYLFIRSNLPRISLAVLKRIGQYCAKPDFKPEFVGRVSFAAKSLCMWVRAMEVYGRIYRVVEPKKKVLV